MIVLPPKQKAVYIEANKDVKFIDINRHEFDPPRIKSKCK